MVSALFRYNFSGYSIESWTLASRWSRCPTCVALRSGVVSSSIASFPLRHTLIGVFFLIGVFSISAKNTYGYERFFHHLRPFHFSQKYIRIWKIFSSFASFPFQPKIHTGIIRIWKIFSSFASFPFQPKIHTDMVIPHHTHGYIPYIRECGRGGHLWVQDSILHPFQLQPYKCGCFNRMYSEFLLK